MKSIELHDQGYYILRDTKTKDNMLIIGQYDSHENMWFVCGSDVFWPTKDFIVVREIILSDEANL